MKKVFKASRQWVQIRWTQLWGKHN